MAEQQFISKFAHIKSKKIAYSACIFGPSIIEKNSIIDPSVIIGYPIRSKTKLISLNETTGPLEALYDESSSGSRVGKRNHIRAFSTIYEDTQLADDVETGTHVIIREKCQIGSGSIIGSATIIDGDVIIGKNARIQSHNFIPPRIRIGDNVFLGPSIRFANDSYPVSSRLIETIVKDHAVIGIASIILPGIIIGERAVVAAGSVVTKDVPSDTVVLGSPAKPIMTKTEYNQKKTSYENQ
ncbi:MAG: DapH/DapD/GlmU-related protein [Candidatus Kariarchaeaceae archaeon]|jgi:acetyltransferase-like isoleucine patch superfamily enzyme